METPSTILSPDSQGQILTVCYYHSFGALFRCHVDLCLDVVDFFHQQLRVMHHYGIHSRISITLPCNCLSYFHPSF